MENDMPKGKPIKTIRKEIIYKECKINYTISIYDKVSSANANIHYNSGTASYLPLKEKIVGTPEEAESKIIEISKQWIDENL